MPSWPNVRWTQARQVCELIDKKSAAALAPDVSPCAHFNGLIEEKDLHAAVFFLCHALPRYEAILWAHKVLTMLRPSNDLDQEGQEAARLIALWVADPDDRKRRNCFQLMQDMDELCAEKLLLAAIYMSGGSISLEDLQPIHPREDIAAKMAASAIILAVTHSGHPDSALTKALEMGEAIAN